MVCSLSPEVDFQTVSFAPVNCDLNCCEYAARIALNRLEEPEDDAALSDVDASGGTNELDNGEDEYADDEDGVTWLGKSNIELNRKK